MSRIPDWARYRTLVVGCGSIGRRHAKNLRSLGLQHLAFCDTSSDALGRCREECDGEFFDDDGQFQEIMTRSKIWATEEVILPTVTALLGHEIAANPCSYDFVKYRVPYTPAQIK